VNIFDPQARSSTEADTIDDTAWGMSLGALWRVNDQWSLGGFYRGAPTFELNIETRSGPAHPELPPDTVERRQTGFMLDFPGVAGAGIAYRSPGGTTTVSFEWDRVFYSWFTADQDPREPLSGGVSRRRGPGSASAPGIVEPLVRI
jgi:hypothetical protein